MRAHVLQLGHILTGTLFSEPMRVETVHAHGSSRKRALQYQIVHPSRDREGANRQGAATIPLAYFITFSCYGTRLHGNNAGSVDRHHNLHGTPFLPPDSKRIDAEHKRMDQAPYELDSRRRDIVLQAVQEVCTHRGWSL